jgi:hypothetical protein
MKLLIKFLLLISSGVSGYVLLTSFSPSGSSVDISRTVEGDPKNAADTFPVPTGNKKMLFYVQRTHNTNTIVYELNYANDSTLNQSAPIHAYWVRYADKGEDKGKSQELSYIQKQYAYGVVTQLIDKEKQTFKVNFVSYKKRDIFLMRSKTDKGYSAYITINGKLVYLEKVFVKIEGGTFWVPHITYVEVTGRDLSGKEVSEKIIP